MKLSQRTLVRLRKHINGDHDEGAIFQNGRYRSGPMLVDLFVEAGFNDIYANGFPSRREYTGTRLTALNGGYELQKLIETVFDRLEFECDHKSYQDVLDDINAYLQRDNYQIVKHGGRVSVKTMSGAQIAPIPIEKMKLLSGQFIGDNVKKCEAKLAAGDYRGAVTNARSLLEEILVGIERQIDPNAKKYNGDLQKLFKRVKTHLNMETDRTPGKDAILQLLVGLNGVVSGLAGVSNAFGDRHGGAAEKAYRHHAELAINISNSLCTYLLSIYENQNSTQD